MTGAEKARGEGKGAVWEMRSERKGVLSLNHAGFVDYDALGFILSELENN